jgi:hypothetical protein
MTIKVRALTGPTLKSKTLVFGSAAGSSVNTIYPEVQKIDTIEHPGWLRRQGGFAGDIGGPFDSRKIKLLRYGRPWVSRANYNPNLGWSYQTDTWLCGGPEVQSWQSSNFNPTAANVISQRVEQAVPFGADSLTMIGMGTKAIDMVKPTNPSVDLATTLAELYAERKFFSVPGKGGGASGEYLNYQFGIAPTVDVIKDFRDTMNNRDAIMRQYQRDSARLIRRQYQWEPQIATTRTESSIPCRTVGEGLNTYQNPGGTLITITTTKQEFKFSGAFRYSIPKGSFPREIAELDRLYGVKPGVSTAWELLPFSWLVDYFAPVGGVLSNMDAFLQDGLVMPFGYLMCTTTVVIEEIWRGSLTDPDGRLTGVEVATLIEKTRKQRIPASPFGFGILAGDLNPKQKSILAALGMSMRK